MGLNEQNSVKRVEVKPKEMLAFNRISLQVCIRSILKERGIDINKPYEEDWDDEKKLHIFTQEVKNEIL